MLTNLNIFVIRLQLIKSIRECGVTCIITSGSISDMGKHFMQKYGIMALKISSQFELRRLCQTTGATAQVNLVGASACHSNHVNWSVHAGPTVRSRVVCVGAHISNLFHQRSKASAARSSCARLDSPKCTCH